MNRFLKLLCPDEYVESVPLIDVSELKRRGIEALLIDLDNTVVPWQRYEVAPGIADWVGKVKEQGIKACIVSNTHSARRLRKLADELKLPCAKRALKPRRGGFREALKLLGVDPANTAVIGDQIFTDVLGGNRLGAHTILVRPLHSREFFGTKISRFFEWILLRYFEGRGMLERSGKPGEQSSDGSRQIKSEN